MFIYVIIIIIIIILIIYYFLILSLKNINEPDDILLHLSSEKETILRSLNNLLLYNKNVSFISLNQLSTSNTYDNGIDKYNLVDNINYGNLKDISNYKNHFIQGFTEIKEENNYLSHKLSSSIPILQPIKIKGKNGNFAYIVKFLRLIDNKEFYYIQMSQTFNYYLNSNSYKAISELLQYIIKNYPGEYIIVGDFNVHGHEKIFKHFLTDNKYHIFETYKYATCNDSEGIASPDGIVISKKLYPKVEFFIDFYTGNSYQHYLVGSNMYMSSSGTHVIIKDKFKNYLSILKTNHGNRKYYIGNQGIFDSKNSNHIGDINNIKTIDLVKSNKTIYTSTALTAKIDS